LNNKFYTAAFIILLSLVISTGCKKSRIEEKDESSEEKTDIASISDSKIISISSSSTLKSENISYRAGNIFDRRPDGSWCEGKKGDGIGQFISLTFDKIVTINKIYIMNGVGDSKFYRKKNRVRLMGVNGVIVKLTDSPYAQMINLDKPVTGKKIDFRINGIYKGNQDDDTCIAELSFSKIGIVPVKSIVLPVKISRGGYSFTIMENGKLNVTGIGDVDCPAVFVRGSWKNNSRGDFVVNYTVKSDKMCGNINRTKTAKSWDFNKMNAVFTQNQLKRVIKF
jgi:hypothetical protein